MLLYDYSALYTHTHTHTGTGTDTTVRDVLIGVTVLVVTHIVLKVIGINTLYYSIIIIIRINTAQYIEGCATRTRLHLMYDALAISSAQ